jgi:hypothetical protein
VYTSQHGIDLGDITQFSSYLDDLHACGSQIGSQGVGASRVTAVQHDVAAMAGEPILTWRPTPRLAPVINAHLPRISAFCMILVFLVNTNPMSIGKRFPTLQEVL